MAIRNDRSQIKSDNKLGYTRLSDHGRPYQTKARPYRSEKIEHILKYYEDRAYEGKTNWHDAEKLEGENYIPIRQRKPFIRLNLPKMMASRLASKLCGNATFPKIDIEQDPLTEEYLRAIIKSAKLKSKLIHAARHMITTGSSFVRFHVVGRKFKVESFCSNYCYPVFDEAGELQEVKVQYVYTDVEDLDDKGKPKRKWYRADIGKMADILYDRPEFKADVDPVFTPLETVDHGLGFVQGEWFRTTESSTGVDGTSLVEDCIPWLDEINYSICKSYKATDYNQDPQLALSGMDEEEISDLVRSVEKAWNMGRDGKGQFLESNLSGVQVAAELRDHSRTFLMDLTRIVLMDPEKIAGHAQSGKALEILHGPMVELINELRPMFEENFINLILKMAVVNLLLARNSVPSPISVPPGFEPQSLDVTIIWPPVFPMTTADLLERTRWVGEAVSRNLISRRTGVRTLAKDFDVEDIELELQEIESQPQLGGGFGFF